MAIPHVRAFGFMGASRKDSPKAKELAMDEGDFEIVIPITEMHFSLSSEAVTEFLIADAEAYIDGLDCERRTFDYLQAEREAQELAAYRNRRWFLTRAWYGLAIMGGIAAGLWMVMR
jgi:hypothetical protein